MEFSKKAKVTKKKVLLMGKSGAGKSSMKSIIFSTHNAKDTRRLGATIDVDPHRVKFLGNLLLDIWDCGGQDAFTESYLTERKYEIFPDVAVLIYVFDVESSDFSPDGGNSYDNSSDRDLQTYARIISALAECSPAARIFALVHKMDLVAENYRDAVADSKFRAIAGRSGRFARNLGIYGTSIWDETLYRAWGSIVNSLIPNLGAVKQALEELKEMTEAEEVVLFEQTTFLTVTRVGNGFGEEGNPYDDRFERLSNIIKTFKGGIGFYAETGPKQQFGTFVIKTGLLNVLINRLTFNTYVLTVFPPGEAEMECAHLNVVTAQAVFARLESLTGDEAYKIRR